MEKQEKIMRKFYVDKEVTNDKIILENDYNHIVNVLRKKIGDKIIIFNNMGVDYECEIEKINKKNIELRVINQKENIKDNKTKITLFQALIKSDKLELIIQKLTELNIDNMFLFESEHTVVKSRETRLDKFNKISIEACKQCERSKSIGLNFIGNFNNLINELKKYDCVFFAYEKSEKPLKDVLKNSKCNNIAIVVGAEGGFSSAEQEKLIKLDNVKEVSLSKNILRAETASIFLSSIMMYEFN